MEAHGGERRDQQEGEGNKKVLRTCSERVKLKLRKGTGRNGGNLSRPHRRHIGARRPQQEQEQCG